MAPTARARSGAAVPARGRAPTSKAEGGPGAKDGAGGPGKNGPGAEGAEGTEGEGEGTGKGEEKGKGGESGGGGGGGGFGGSIGDFFQAILDNPISAILTALPFITNPVGLLGATALLAVFADHRRRQGVHGRSGGIRRSHR